MRFSQLGIVLPQGDIWQCLKSLLIVESGTGSASGTYWVKAREAALHPIMRSHSNKELLCPDSVLFVRNSILK